MLRGHEGDDFLDGGPARTPGQPAGTGEDVLEGGPGGDTYPLYWGMGEDAIIETADGKTNVLALSHGASLASVKAVRDGDDLRVTLRGSDDGVRVINFFTAQNPASWRIESAESGQSLLELFLAQTDVSYEPGLMNDYKQRLLNSWRAEGDTSFALPTHAYVASSESITESLWWRIVPALPNPIRAYTSFITGPVRYSSVRGFGQMEGRDVIPMLILLEFRSKSLPSGQDCPSRRPTCSMAENTG